MDPRSVRRGAAAASLLALLSLIPTAAATDTDGFEGDLTVHTTLDAPAQTEAETCVFYVRGHGAPGSEGTVTFLYAPNGTFEPMTQELAFEGTANATGGFDFVAGPFDVPVRVDPAQDPMRANLLVANITTDDGSVQWFLQGLRLTCRPNVEVPFFTSPLAIVLALAGIVATGFVLRRRR